MSPHTHSGSTSSSSGSSSNMAGDMMTMESMQMVFYTSDTTALYSLAWSPMSTGSYAGTCIFLIILAVIFRSLVAGKHMLERRWNNQALQRRYVKVRGRANESEAIDADGGAKEGLLLSAGGVEQDVRVVKNKAQPVMPFRLSVDLPRAAYVTLIAGVGYLLMLAVMTLNVGYFLSVLGGIFAGEVLVGRYIQSAEH